MNIIPSIDLLNGKCVRLCNGKQNTAVYYDINPVDYINNLVSHDIKHIHIVDLDKAFGNINTDNKKVIKDILTNINDITINIGGGIRTKAAIEEYLKLDVSQICLGTLTIDNQEFVKELLNEYGPDKFIFCPDVNKEFITIHGWKVTSNVHMLTYFSYWCQYGIRDFICTDIEKDGTLSGTSVELYNYLNNEFKKEYTNLNIIASGGVSSIDNIKALQNIGINSVIIGKALFENKISLNDLVNV